MTKQTEGVDILSFDAVSMCEQAIPLAMKGPDGTSETGVTLLVLGKHADAVTKWGNKLINDQMREAQIAQRKGRPLEPKSMEQVREQNYQGAAIRVVGWQGVKQPFEQELLMRALRRNPHWVDQIVEASDDLGNFTSKPSAS